MAINNKIFQISIFKSLWLNMHYFPLKTAIKLPILLSRRVNIRKLKGSVIIKCPVKTGLLRFGFDSLGIVDYKHNNAVWENNGVLELNGIANIGAATKLIISGGGWVTVGDKVRITGLSYIISKRKISIGDGCLISWDVQIMDTDFHTISDSNGKITNSPKEINIGNHVWIGCRNLILKGSKIPDNCIIAADSLINKELSNSNCIYGGNPIKEIKADINWTI